MMESEALDWKVAGVGPVRCRREPGVCSITRAAGGEGTGWESLMHLPAATLKEADADGHFLHTKHLGVGVSDLSLVWYYL